MPRWRRPEGLLALAGAPSWLERGDGLRGWRASVPRAQLFVPGVASRRSRRSRTAARAEIVSPPPSASARARRLQAPSVIAEKLLNSARYRFSSWRAPCWYFGEPLLAVAIIALQRFPFAAGQLRPPLRRSLLERVLRLPGPALDRLGDRRPRARCSSREPTAGAALLPGGTVILLGVPLARWSSPGNERTYGIAQPIAAMIGPKVSGIGRVKICS